MKARITESFKTIEPKRLMIYMVVYFVWGMLMNYIGQWLEIAKFHHWWQVLTTYLLYMIPVSIALRPFPVFTQYAYGLVAMGLLEFGGYALGTSYIYPDNILERLFGSHTFALLMALFFASYFPIGNWVVNRLFLLFVDKNGKK